ncbi:hypothetical protein GCM10023085_03040 [Actinomadura viridis]|uniref:Secreted protein n=1 Tax=Actinomadura viridis TaxID=58110 RepID=A0A931DNC6_9ACTN|nr:hypothetical protein [Actinomadura viridis]MBG6091122.1 hypothetical protein [Actinomadura viridis]
MTVTGRRRVAALALLPVLALGLPGCGGGNGEAKVAPVSDQEKMRRYAQCMRQNGVDMPDPADKGGLRVKARRTQDAGREPGKDEVRAADAKCRPLMPNGGKPPKADPEAVARQRALARCMRQNGVPEFPDPDANGGIRIRSGPGGSGIDPESATFQAAQKACAGHRPKGPVPAGGAPMVGGKTEGGGR